MNSTVKYHIIVVIEQSIRWPLCVRLLKYPEADTMIFCGIFHRITLLQTATLSILLGGAQENAPFVLYGFSSPHFMSAKTFVDKSNGLMSDLEQKIC